MEWNENKTLIEMYCQRHLLWNSILADFKNRNKCHDTLLEIRVSFRTDKDEIENKLGTC